MDALEYALKIRDGGSFDTTDAIRALAELATSPPQEASPKTAALPAGSPKTMTTQHQDISPILHKRLRANVADILIANNYTTFDRIYFATDEELLQLDGIGQGTVQTLRSLFADPRRLTA